MSAASGEVLVLNGPSFRVLSKSLAEDLSKAIASMMCVATDRSVPLVSRQQVAVDLLQIVHNNLVIGALTLTASPDRAAANIAGDVSREEELDECWSR